MIYHDFVGSSWGSGRTIIENNYAEFSSDLGRRGIGKSITSGTVPAGRVRVRGNDFTALGGNDYGRVIEPFAVK